LGTFDLQCHSTSSDGSLPPEEVVALAATSGVRTLALSDHDTVAGVDEAIRAGSRHGVRIVPAVEISAVDDAGRAPRELHILGYLIDHRDGRLRARLADFLADRERRTLRMGDALREAGFELDDRELRARVRQRKPIGRPHLAEAALSSPQNAGRLRAEGIDDIGSLIRGYLIEGRPAFRLRETPTIAEAVQTIHEARGVAIWAHPFWDISEEQEVLATIDRYRALGIDGVEAFYVTHTPEQTDLLASRCAELGMLTTGSSDFHGPENRLFHRFLAFDTFGHEPNLGPIATATESR
jgi:3',5'-nucleoside bisphosphate phosphatase